MKIDKESNPEEGWLAVKRCYDCLAFIIIGIVNYSTTGSFFYISYYRTYGV